MKREPTRTQESRHARAHRRCIFMPAQGKALGTASHDNSSPVRGGSSAASAPHQCSRARELHVVIFEKFERVRTQTKLVVILNPHLHQRFEKVRRKNAALQQELMI